MSLTAEVEGNTDDDSAGYRLFLKDVDEWLEWLSSGQAGFDFDEDADAEN